MKFSRIHSVILTSLMVMTTCHAMPSGSHILLDSSNDVLFEEFSTNAYTLQLLQVKDEFPNQDLVLGGVGYGPFTLYGEYDRGNIHANYSRL